MIRRLDVCALSAAYLAESAARRLTRSRTIRYLLPTMAAAVIAGAAGVLGVAAARDVGWDPAACMLLALASVWLMQGLVVMSRTARKDRRP